MERQRFCNSLVGYTKENALLICKFLKFKIRISREDDYKSPFIVDIDYNRMNLGIENGKIISAYFG